MNIEFAIVAAKSANMGTILWISGTFIVFGSLIIIGAVLNLQIIIGNVYTNKCENGQRIKVSTASSLAVDQID